MDWDEEDPGVKMGRAFTNDEGITMPFKVIRGKQYKWAASRGTESQAYRIKTGYERTGKVYAEIVTRRLGSLTALVPTVYEIYVRPTEEGKKEGYTLKSRKLETFIRVKIVET